MITILIISVASQLTFLLTSFDIHQKSKRITSDRDIHQIYFIISKVKAEESVGNFLSIKFNDNSDDDFENQN
jgi:hypothetical protein